MNPSTFVLILVAAVVAVVHGGPPATVVPHGPPAINTPEALFWEQALPGTPMPGAIAHLVQKGVDRSSLLVDRSAVSPSGIGACTLFDSTCSAKKVAETGIFFHETQLRPGSTMTLSFPAEAEPAILPRDVAEKVPFEKEADVLSAFNIPAGSAEAVQVSDTLSKCQAAPIPGEVKSCTTSLEATVRSAMRMLGATSLHDGGVWAAASELSSAGLPRQQYAVTAVTPLDGIRYVSCHMLPFPYAVYECHKLQQTGYRAYKVSLSALKEGSTVAMLAFCHLDTANWNPAHPAFEVLQTRPGGTPVCHFMPYGNLAFVKKATTA